MGVTYRGTSNTYYAAQLWMTGGYNFTDDKPPQPFIPIVAYWDDYDKVPWALPHVYDYMEGRDAVSNDYLLLSGTYNRRHYLTTYGKEQKAEFGNIIVDRNGGNPDSYSGIVSVSEGMVTMGDNGSAAYRFSVSTAGTYDVAVRLCFPIWDKNGIYISIDGGRKHFTESRLWWPYWRTAFRCSLSLWITPQSIFLCSGILPYLSYPPKRKSYVPAPLFWILFFHLCAYFIFNLSIPSWAFQNTIAAAPMSRF